MSKSKRKPSKSRTLPNGAHQDQRISELEILLAEKEKKILDQSQLIKKLTKERNELRNKNAMLVGKLAEVSRKHSGTLPPGPQITRSLHRSSTSRLPSIPPTPNAVLHPQYSFPVPSSNGKPSPPESGQDTPSSDHLPLPASIKASSHAEEDSDTDYSDLEEDKEPVTIDSKKTPTSESNKMEISLSEDAMINKELAAVMGSKWNHPSSNSPHLAQLHRERQKSNSSTSSSTSSSSSDGKESGYTVNSLAKQVIVEADTKPIRKIGSSEGLASRIRQMQLPKKNSPPDSSKRTNSLKFKSSSEKERSTVADKKPDKPSSTPVQNGNAHLPGDSTGSESKTRPISIPSSSESLMKGEVAKRRAIFETSPSVDSIDFSLTNGRKDSVSSEYTNTDMESSIDTSSPQQAPPLNKPLENLKSTLKSLPDLANKNKSKSKKKVTLNHKVQDDSNIVDEEEEDQLNELESFEMNVRSRTQTLSALTGGKRRVEMGRKRPKVHRREQMKRANSTFVTSPSSEEVESIPLDRTKFRMELELFSPLLATKIKTMTLKRIYIEYGGKDVVTRAVKVIEDAYQTYRLRKRFLERLKESKENRTMKRKKERAHSMRHPNRRPSIMNKQGRYGNRRGSNVDPMAKSKETVERMAKERLPHAHSGSRMQLVERRRSANSLRGESVGEDEEEEEGIKTLKVKTESKNLLPTISVSQIEFKEEEETCEVKGEKDHILYTLKSIRDDVCDNTPPDIVTTTTVAVNQEEKRDEIDGIAGSDSTQSFISVHRPVSIFSATSNASNTSYDSREFEVSKSFTLPHPHHLSRTQDQKRELDMALMTGIHHFNRKPTKGIQYLIGKSLLEDDPRKVADFFLCQKELSKEKIGEFLGEINSEFNMAVLESLVERTHMGDKPIDEALREFQQLFRMPGEAQKIDKIMEVFALEFYRRHKCEGIFKSEDAAYILSFAIMMLHTSLHNPSVKTRTSKKQWISMNRGTNDGENFPDDVLLDIFDRIQVTEFETGRDHTHVVADIEKQITGSTIQKLSTPQRYLVHRLNVTEIQELNARPSFRTKHRRIIFFFNDIMVVCKRRHHQEYAFKESFSLLGILPVKFETHYYKCGIQLHAVDRDTPYQFNCDSSSDREHLVQCLETIIMQLKVLDSERIAELGNTLSSNTTKQELDAGGHTRTKKHTLSCDAGDLISSVNLTLPDSPPSLQHRGDFVPGVGDLALSTTVSSSVMTRHMSENRISRDSGFDSQQLTPTPPPSPSPSTSMELDARTTSPSSPSYQTSTQSPSTSLNTLTPSTPPPRSKSSDTIKNLAVNPSSPSRSPSLDFKKKKGRVNPLSSNMTNSPQSDGSPKGTRKKNEKKTTKGGFFGRKRGSADQTQGKTRIRATLSLNRDGPSSPQPRRKSLTGSYENGSDRNLELSM